MKLFVAVVAALLVGHVALAQPPEASTDVDETTSASEAAPLAPAQGAQAVEAAAEVKAAEPARTPTSPKPTPDEIPLRPAFLADPAIRLDGNPTESDRTYETRVLGAFHATQGSQGPLDGGWRVFGIDGSLLYTLQLTDPGAGEARIEGAWRNPRQSGAAASGFIDWVTRENEDVVLVFRETTADPATQVRLRPSLTGSWAGEALNGEHRTAILVNRAQGLETAALSVPAWSPPPPPRAKASPPRASKSKARPRSKARPKRRR